MVKKLLFYINFNFFGLFSTLYKSFYCLKNFKYISYFFIVIICFASFNCSKSLAYREVPTDTLDIARNSDYIVVAKCTSSVSKWNDQKTLIFTYTTFSINQNIMKNSLEKEITLRILGGQVDDKKLTGPDIPNFTEGEEVILFLSSKNKYGFYNLKSIRDGVLRIQIDEKAGDKIVITKTTGIDMYDRNTNKTLKTKAQDGVSLENFIFSLRKAIDQ